MLRSARFRGAISNLISYVVIMPSCSSARFRGAIRNIMSYAMDHGKHLTFNCSAAGVLVMISKSAKDASNHSSSSAEWFVFIMRKTTSTVVTLQAGPGIFVIGFALYGILFDPLRDSLWSAAFCSRMKKKFLFELWYRELHTTIGEAVCMENKNERICCFFLRQLQFFVLVILLGRALCISFVIRANSVVSIV